MTGNSGFVYIVTNTVECSGYVGSSRRSDPSTRWNEHRWELNGNRHHNPRLQEEWNRLGPGAFTFEVLEFCDPEEVINREQFHIDRGYGKTLYNINPVAGMPPDSTGRVLSEQTKHKISETLRHRERTEKEKEKIRESHLGRKHSEVTKAKIRAHNQGKIVSEDTKRKLSEALKGNKNGRKAKNDSPPLQSTSSIFLSEDVQRAS
jgi:group I intron endonuclease